MPPPRALFVLRLACLVAIGVSMALLLDSLRPQPAFCLTGSGCDHIRKLHGRVAGVPVPALGLVAYGSLLSLTFFPALARLTSVVAMLGGLIALGLLAFQAFVINTFCKLCVMVDMAGLVAAAAGVSLLRAPAQRRDVGLLAWVGALTAALGLPFALAELAPAPPVPRPILSLWKPGHINVVEFSDFECPYCRIAHPRIEAAIHALGDGAKINLVRKTMPLPSHPHARVASRAYLCADDRGKGDAMADKLFTGELDRASIDAAAESLGLPMDAFRTCLADPATDERVEAHIRFVRSAEFQGLPTLWVNDQKILGARDQADYNEAFKRAAAGHGAQGGRAWPLALVLVLSIGLIALGVQSARKHPDPAPP